MKLLRLAVVPLAVLAVAAVAGCGGGTKSVPGDAVAVVGSKDIAKSDFDSLINQLKTSYKTQGRKFPPVGTREYSAIKAQAIQFLVERAEFEQKAGDLGVNVSDKQVDQRLAQIKAQYFVNPPGKPAATKSEIEKRYRDQIKKQGLTDKQVHEAIKSQLIREAVFNKVTSGVKVSDKDITDYYNSHKSQYQTPKQGESRQVRHILVKTKGLADRVYNLLKGGGNFAVLAKKYSQDPGSKNTGGLLTISRHQTVPPFDKVAFALKVNEISKPVHTQYGWHIIQAVGPIMPPKAAHPTPLSQVKEAIRQQLIATKRQEEMRKWLNDTRKEFAHKIAYQPGYAPPATATSSWWRGARTTSSSGVIPTCSARRKRGRRGACARTGSGSRRARKGARGSSTTCRAVYRRFCTRGRCSAGRPRSISSIRTWRARWPTSTTRCASLKRRSPARRSPRRRPSLTRTSWRRSATSSSRPSTSRAA